MLISRKYKWLNTKTKSQLIPMFLKEEEEKKSDTQVIAPWMCSFNHDN